jgi:capsule polysaccharide export protein KpsE/RkpR
VSSDVQENIVPPTKVTWLGRDASGDGDSLHSAQSAMPGGTVAGSVFQLWRHRRFIVTAAAVGFIVATAIAFLLPPKFESTTRLMPPDKQGTAGLASLLATGAAGGNLNAVPLLSEALGANSAGALVVGVLRSLTVQDHIIEQFDLTRVYGVRYLKDARQRLLDSTDFTLDQKSGIITITVTDKSPQRARDMARAYATELNSVLARLDTSAARKERIFIEERLKTVKGDMDEAAQQLARYSSENTTLDIKEQTKAMVESAAKLQGELVAAQAELSGIRQIYTDNTARVRAARARVAELKNQIGKMSGSTISRVDAGNESAPYPPIRKLPLLGVKYFDLYRNARMQETIYEILTRQHELATIQEVKELPTVRVLDEPVIAQKKSKPHRLVLMLSGLLLGAFFSSVCVLGSSRWQAMGPEEPLKVLGLAVREGLAEDLRLIRAHLPISKASSNGHGSEPVGAHKE